MIRRKFYEDQSASVMPVIGIGLTAIVGLVGATLALGLDGQAAANVQSTADSSALAGATAFINHASPKAQDRLSEAKTVAEAVARSNSNYVIANMNVSPMVEDAYGQHTSIEVALSFEPANVFAKLKGRSGSVEITRRAVAQATSGFPLCVLTLAQDGAALTVSGGSLLEAENCTIWSNSKGQSSLNFINGKTKAQAICTAGKYRKSTQARLQTLPDTDCEQIPDPMADWTLPDNGPCTETTMIHIWEPPEKTAKIKPGVYCGGMLVDASDAVFEAGIYEFRGPLILNSGGSVRANEAAFMFKGNGSYLSVQGDSRFEMTAPETGPLAGIAIAGDRTTGLNPVDIDAAIDRHFVSGDLFGDGYADDYDKAFFRAHYHEGHASSQIGAAGAIDLQGVIYLPSQHVRFTGAGSGRQVSPLLQIVADRLTFQEGSALKIDFDPAQSTVPVRISPKKSAVLVH